MFIQLIKILSFIVYNLKVLIINYPRHIDFFNAVRTINYAKFDTYDYIYETMYTNCYFKTKVNKTYPDNNNNVSAGVKNNWLSISKKLDFLDFSYELRSENSRYLDDPPFSGDNGKFDVLPFKLLFYNVRDYPKEADYETYFKYNNQYFKINKSSNFNIYNFIYKR